MRSLMNDVEAVIGPTGTTVILCAAITNSMPSP